MNSNHPIWQPSVVPQVPENYPLHDVSEEGRNAFSELKSLLESNPLTIDDTPLTEREVNWMDDRCLVRYLKATKNNIKQAVSRLQKTLQWRREFKPDEIDPQYIEPEATSGKEIVSGFDLKGRPILYLFPIKENSSDGDKNIQFVVFNLEVAIRLMPKGVDQMVFFVDYENMNMFNSPKISNSRRVLQILGDHYPERLAKGFMVNPSWYLSIAFKLIGPFIDTETRSKIHFINSKDTKKSQNDIANNIATSENTTRSNSRKSSKSNVQDEAVVVSPISTDDNSIVETVGSSSTSSETKEVEIGGWIDSFDPYISKENIFAKFGGAHEFEYDHQQYWQLISEIYIK